MKSEVVSALKSLWYKSYALYVLTEIGAPRSDMQE